MNLPRAKGHTMHTAEIHTSASDHFPSDGTGIYAVCSCGDYETVTYFPDGYSGGRSDAIAAATDDVREHGRQAREQSLSRMYMVSSANVSADMTLNQIGDWLDARPQERVEVSVRKYLTQ